MMRLLKILVMITFLFTMKSCAYLYSVDKEIEESDCRSICIMNGMGYEFTDQKRQSCYCKKL